MSPDGVLVLTVSVAGLAAELYAGALPERATVAAWPADTAHRGVVSDQCWHAGGASLAVGVVSSVVTRSWWPLLATLAVVAYLSGSYHTAAASTRYTQPETSPGLETRRWAR